MLPTPNNGSGLFGTGQAGQASSTTLRTSLFAQDSVLLQFQILFDGVEEGMNSSKDFP